MKTPGPAMIIHIFALLHAATALICRAMGITDELMLTLLTMLMVVLLCFRRGVHIEVTAAAVVIGNIAGYGIGFLSAWLLGRLSIPALALFPLSTFLTTEIIGFSVYGATALCKRDEARPDAKSMLWIIAAVVVVYMVRAAMSLIFNYHVFDENAISQQFLYFLSIFAALIVILIIFLAGYAVSARRKAEKEKEKRHLAQFRYMKLNQQVNPHFLFNSLNILDCLVTENKNEQASTYIHKLAGLYRYMLKSEDETIVKLRDEMEFCGQYVDLLLVRFPEGLEVSINIAPEYEKLSVVPCSVQLLIENATKHNSVSTDKPLRISIDAGPDGITVRNNLSPKLSHGSSTGLGLKYIRQQYNDLAGKDITITKGEDDFTVVLPFI